MSASLSISPERGEARKTFVCAPVRPLRVLTLTPFFPSAEEPGQGGFVAEPLATMSFFGISNTIIAAQPFYQRGRTTESPGATWGKYFSVPGNAGLVMAGRFLAARILPVLLKKHREMPFDVIHAHAALPCGQAAAIIGRRLSIPFVVTVHGLDAFFTRQAGAVAGNWCARVAERVYGSASAVICISEKVREQVISKTHSHTTVIYNGVDTEKFYPEPESSPQLKVLSVGNLTAIKGHALLLRAFSRLLRDFADCSLEIIGDGPERERLRHLAAELGIAKSVHFHGRQNREDVAEAMRQCTVFALPSTYEGLGCVYLEAMACAKPAIGCRGQGIEEVIEHGKTGMLVTPESEKELTEELLTLLRDRDLRRRIGTNARAMILDRLTLNHQAQQLADVYRRCAG
ncbi:MAG TPA: glycosyltransferase [Terriglobales bacterium]|nr:glycosyltransferase [Terriglobales bacterium]